MKSIFTIPKLIKYDDLSKPWYIYFRYDNKLFRFKHGINYINNYRKREIEGKLICDAYHQKLKEGWNPLVPDIVDSHSEMTLPEAIDFAMEKKAPNLSSKTISCYKGTIKFIKIAISSVGMNEMKIVEIKRVHIRHIVEKAKEQRKWSNKAYNKHLNHLKAILSELLQWDIIETNPAHKINNLPVAASEANIPASLEEVKKIKSKLMNNHPDFYKFISTIFHTGIRPEEITKLQLHMVDLKACQIVIPADITKTNIKRIVPINQHLMLDYLSMNFENLPGEFYLFGSNRDPGKGNIGSFKDFIPGPTKMKRDTATKRWNKIVKKGLGIEMNMYAMKHLGADRKILAGIDLDSLRELYGHTSKLMTEKYAKVVKEVYRKQILENSPEL